MLQRHPEALKLFRNIEKHSDAETATRIAFGVDLPPCPDVEEATRWVMHVIRELEETFDEQTIKAIRLGCYCTDSLETSRELVRREFDKSSSMEEFVSNMNTLGADWRVVDGELHTTYPSCPCPLLQGIDRLPSKTWCYCTAGVGKDIFLSVFGCDVDVDILEAVKLGNPKCVIRITPHIAPFA